MIFQQDITWAFNQIHDSLCIEYELIEVFDDVIRSLDVVAFSYAYIFIIVIYITLTLCIHSLRSRFNFLVPESPRLFLIKKSFAVLNDQRQVLLPAFATIISLNLRTLSRFSMLLFFVIRNIIRCLSKKVTKNATFFIQWRISDLF